MLEPSLLKTHWTSFGTIDQLAGCSSDYRALLHSYRRTFCTHSSVLIKHQFNYIDTKILMVLDIPQGDLVPLSRHC
jgi:hypothetical protein